MVTNETVTVGPSGIPAFEDVLAKTGSVVAFVVVGVGRVVVGVVGPCWLVPPRPEDVLESVEAVVVGVVGPCWLVPPWPEDVLESVVRVLSPV